MKTTLAAITAGFSLIVGVNCAEAATVNLYTGAGAPANQSWLTFTNINRTSFTPVAIETSGAGAVNLNTEPSNGIYAGYSNYNLIGNLKNAAFPPLDRTTGYTLNFAVQNNSEFHDGTNGPNRAGFSVIALSNDLQGIELGFWTDQIWAQNFDPVTKTFTKGESNSFDTQSSLTSYALIVTGNTYTLSANGTPLTNLTNQALRDYSAFGAPYNTPNLIFLGDDTTSARANINLGAVSVTTAVPFEFSPTLGLLILGSCAAVSHLKNKKNNNCFK